MLTHRGIRALRAPLEGDLQVQREKHLITHGDPFAGRKEVHNGWYIEESHRNPQISMHCPSMGHRPPFSGGKPRNGIMINDMENCGHSRKPSAPDGKGKAKAQLTMSSNDEEGEVWGVDLVFDAEWSP